MDDSTLRNLIVAIRTGIHYKRFFGDNLVSKDFKKSYLAESLFN